MIAPALEVAWAYRICGQITRREAANFFYGIRLLPRAKRDAMCAVYAYARRVDDIGDGHLPKPAKLSLLSAEREGIAALDERAAADEPLDPVFVALSHAARSFDLPVDALEAVIDGVEADVNDTEYETFDALVGYCSDVAGSIGRLCLAIFLGAGGDPSGTGADLAEDIGLAMQLTNILRDIREDRERGRVYLPKEDLAAFGCEDLEGAARAAELIRFEAGRASAAFDRGMGLLELLDPRSASCLLAMTGIYRRILERIQADPTAVLSRRISLSVGEKSWIAARSLLALPQGAAA